MVDALREARRALRTRGLLVDARPDSRVLARIEHRGRIVASIGTLRPELANDAASDAAVATVKRAGLFRRLRAGRFWHRVEFADRLALDAYLTEHARFRPRPRWSIARRTRVAWREDPFVLVRAIRFEVLERREAGATP